MGAHAFGWRAGLKDIGLITGNQVTLVQLNTPLSSNNTDFQKIWLGIVVLLIMATLISRNVPGAILIGILFGACGGEALRLG